jgi:hypothetical protein
MSDARGLLRHTVATLAYRAEKVLRDVPEAFPTARVSEASRSAIDIVHHLGDLMEWAVRMSEGTYKWAPNPADGWDMACGRFFDGLAALDAAIVTSDFADFTEAVIFQGPVADALTHIGQLAMLRGVVGAPVRPESYARAAIEAGRVGREQSSVRKEFDGDASARR